MLSLEAGEEGTPCGVGAGLGAALGVRGAGGGLCHRILLETQASDASLTEQFSLSGERVVNWDAVNLDCGMDAQCVPCPLCTLGFPLVGRHDAAGD